MPETPENQTNDIIPILRPAARDPGRAAVSVCLKAGKVQCSSPQAVWQEAAHALGGSVFFLYAELYVIGCS